MAEQLIIEHNVPLRISNALRKVLVVGGEDTMQWFMQHWQRHAWVDKHGVTPLMVACNLNNRPLFDIVLCKLTSKMVTNRDHYGRTALHWLALGALIYEQRKHGGRRRRKNKMERK